MRFLAARKWLLLCLVASSGAIITKIVAECHATEGALILARAIDKRAAGELKAIPEKTRAESKAHARNADLFRSASQTLLLVAVPLGFVSAWKRETPRPDSAMALWIAAVCLHLIIV